MKEKISHKREGRPYNPIEEYRKHHLAILRRSIIDTLMKPEIDLSPFPGIRYAWLNLAPGHLDVVISSRKEHPSRKIKRVVEIDREKALKALRVNLGVTPYVDKSNADIEYTAELEAIYEEKSESVVR